MSNVLKATHMSVVEGKISAKKVAATIGKPYSTLLREINPMDLSLIHI